MAADDFGILASAVYVPRWRVRRETISAATGWAKGLGGGGKGQRSFANWDEDAITMATEAGRAVLEGTGTGDFDTLSLASTTLPFADRSNCGIVREALNLNADLSTSDIGGSRRAATSNLARLLNSATGRHLLCASDCVDAMPASEAEMRNGHGAAALTIGTGEPVARLLACASLNEDFVDQYRMSDQRFEYQLEARWVRDAGTIGQVGNVVGRALEAAGVQPADIDWFLTSSDAGVTRKLAATIGLESARTGAQLLNEIGNCGAAHPLILLSWALDQAEAGDKILLLGAGQGFDALLLETTGKSAANISDGFGDVRLEENYTRYLALRRVLEVDTGIRSERDNRTALSAFYRRHEQLTGFIGGHCTACGKLQFPMAAICVHCHEPDTQVRKPMSGLDGTINSYTEDWLAFTPRPPLIFGNIHFPGQANLIMEFTDFLPDEAEAGASVRMAFRIKDFDTRRNFRRYFWKSAPLNRSVGHG